MLPKADQDRFGELWEGYEQVFGSVFQDFLEIDLNISIDNLTLFSSQRWLFYEFNETNQVLKAATYTSNQDLSEDVNVATRFLVHFRVDGTNAFEVDVRGIDPLSTSIDEIKSKINAQAGFTFTKGVFQNSVLSFKSPTIGPTSKIEILPASTPANDASEILLGFLVADLPVFFPEFPFQFSIPYERVAGIPAFRLRIRDETDDQIHLDQDIDFDAGDRTGVVSFKETPPSEMWAKRTFVDDETPFNMFGFLMDIYATNSPLYRQVVQGLWFAFWSGPKPENVRRSLYLLFGLPVGQEDAVVISVSPTQIVTLSEDKVSRVFEVPSGLVPIVAVGDIIEKFQPLVDGIDVKDKINSPGFIENDIGRAGIQRFLLDEATRGPGDTDETKALTMLEEHTFLPQIGVDAFISPDINLSNVKTFLEAIKPLSKTFLFQVIVGTFRDEMPLEELLRLAIDINVTPNVDSNQTTFLETADLDDYEAIDNPDLDLDSDGMLFGENVAIEVFSFGGLIDSFVA